MEMRDRVVLLLSSTAVVAGTVAGFAVSTALGFAVLCVQLWVVVAAIVLSDEAPEPKDEGPGKGES